MSDLSPRTITAESSRTVFVVRVNTDLTEGRGYQYIKHVTAMRATALRLANRADVQGSDGDVHEATAYLIGGQWYAPVHIESPSAADEKHEAVYLAQVERQKRRDSAIDRARSLGMSEADIADLRMEHTND